MFIAKRTLWTISLLLASLAIQAETPQSPNLGRPATPTEITAWDIDIAPDGAGLPPGRGTIAAGEALYNTRCEICHGPEGIGGSADALAGAEESLTDKWPDKTIGNYWPYATTLFDFIRRAMPLDTPGSLSADEIYALTGYLLYLNGIIDEDKIVDADSLRKVTMPNQNGFLTQYPESER